MKNIPFNDILQTAADATIIIDESGTIQFYNKAAERIFGYKADEVVGKNITTLMPPSYREAHLQGLKEYLKTGKAKVIGIGQQVQVEGLRKDGTMFVMDLSISSTKTEDGEGIFVGTIRDVMRDLSQRSMVELSELVASLEDQLKKAKNPLADTYKTKEDWSRKDFLNPFMYILLAFMMTNLVLDVFIPSGVSCGVLYSIAVAAALVFNLRTVVPTAIISTVFTIAGAFLYWDGSGVSINTISQETPMWEIICNRTFAIAAIWITALVSKKLKRLLSDITRHTNELERSNEELQQFAYVASHDLQEPLRMISSYLQLIKKRYVDKLDETANEFIGFAVDGANRMKMLIQDLLSYSRVQTRAQPFIAVRLQDTMKDVLQDLSSLILDKCAVVTHDPLPVIRGDASQIKQLIQNLINNSLKFCKKDDIPRVHLGVKESSDHWTFSVHDNGIGIGKQYHDKIFVIFQRLHSKEEYQGTGIGLAICKKIAERHGGRIWVESEVGHGSTFFFTLPK